MKGHGFKVLLILFFLVLSGYYLYPTFQNFMIQRQLASLEGEALDTYEREEPDTEPETDTEQTTGV